MACSRVDFRYLLHRAEKSHHLYLCFVMPRVSLHVLYRRYIVDSIVIEIMFKKLLCHGYNIKSSSREYKPLRLPVLHLKEKKKEWMADIAAWAKAEATVFKYGPILPDIVRMINVFKVKEGIFMAPRNSDDVDMVVRDDYLEAARELYKELDIDTKKTGQRWFS